VEGGEKIARYTFAGANPEEVFRYASGACVLESRDRIIWEERDRFRFCGNIWRGFRPVPFAGFAAAGARRDRVLQCYDMDEADPSGSLNDCATTSACTMPC